MPWKVDLVKFSELEPRSTVSILWLYSGEKNVNGTGRLWEVDCKPLVVMLKIQCQMITSVCASSKVYGSIRHSVWIAGMSRNSMLKISIRKNLNGTFMVKGDLKPSKLEIISPEDKPSQFCTFFSEAFDVDHLWRLTVCLVSEVDESLIYGSAVFAELC